VEDWQDKHYAFTQNRQCEHFPCHAGADRESFNCLFCYCPLYALGKRCGGKFRYLENGFKDCSRCTFPHERENYGAVLERYGDIIKLMKFADAQYKPE
jgi:Zn-finger protein